MDAPTVPEDLRGVAAAAARGFLGQEAELSLIGHGESLAYRAQAPGGPYLLRVHASKCPPTIPACCTDEAIESECAWLCALGQETELVVQEPVPNPAGGYLLRVPRAGGAGGTGGTVACTLLTWVEGVHVEGRRTQAQARALGELLATLHDHAQGWRPPTGFVRPTHDRAAWPRALARIDGLVEQDIVSGEDRDLLVRAAALFDGELSPLTQQPERLGLIHGDLHGENYVVHGDQVRPIDFGRAGFGPWLYDLAECVAGVGPQRRRDLVDAYGARRPLVAGDVRRIEGYMVASLVEVFGHHAPNPDEHDYLSRAVPAWAPHVRRYVGGHPFLFEL